MAKFYADNMLDLIDSQYQTGTLFEDDICAIFASEFPKLKNHRGTSLDKYEGTDFSLFDMRMDSTLNFSDKKWMPFWFETDIPATDTENFKMGIRHGNSYKGYSEFSKPVVVIGLDMESVDYKKNRDQIINNMRTHIQDLFNYAEAAYSDYTELDKEERNYLEITPLRKNDKYRPPRHIGERYQALNNFQYSTMETKNTELGG